MKKILLTERQSKKLVDKIINEQVPAMRATEYALSDGRYHMKCQFNLNYEYEGLITYKGGEIDDISDGLGDVSFLIEMDHEQYGIKKIKITDIKGPNAIKATIQYYPVGSSSDDEDWWEKRIEEKTTIPLNWRKLKVDNGGYRMNYYGVDKVIDVDLKPDGNGGLIGDIMEATTKEYEGGEYED